MLTISNLLVCSYCPATAKNTGKERNRFLARHGSNNCKHHKPEIKAVEVNDELLKDKELETRNLLIPTWEGELRG